MVSFMPRPLYRQGKSPWYPLDRRLDFDDINMKLFGLLVFIVCDCSRILIILFL
jgi:hypothetical protein